MPLGFQYCYCLYLNPDARGSWYKFIVFHMQNGKDVIDYASDYAYSTRRDAEGAAHEWADEHYCGELLYEQIDENLLVL